MKLGSCFNQYGTPANWATDLAAIAAIPGKLVVRTDAVWEYCNPSGEPGHYDFTNLDARLNAIEAHGLRAHLMIPMWAPKRYLAGKPDKTQIKTPAALADFVTFNEALAAHLAPRTSITTGEAGNEVDLREPFAPDGADPVWQAEVTSAIVPTWPAHWKTCSPGLSQNTDGGGNDAPVTYAKAYFPRLTVKLDFAAIHAYDVIGDDKQSWSILGQIPAFHVAAGLELMVTEQNATGNDATKAVEEPKALDYLAGLGYVRRTFIYAASDPGTDNNERWGYLNANGTPRPEYAAIKTWAATHGKQAA